MKKLIEDGEELASEEPGWTILGVVTLKRVVESILQSKILEEKDLNQTSLQKTTELGRTSDSRWLSEWGGAETTKLKGLTDRPTFKAAIT